MSFTGSEGDPVPAKTYDELEAENARLRRWLVMPVHARLIEHLLSIAVEHEGRLSIKHPPTQGQMAEAIGACREHVCRILNDLQRKKLVEPIGRGNERRRIDLSPRLREGAE